MGVTLRIYIFLRTSKTVFKRAQISRNFGWLRVTRITWTLTWHLIFLHLSRNCRCTTHLHSPSFTILTTGSSTHRTLSRIPFGSLRVLYQHIILSRIPFSSLQCLYGLLRRQICLFLPKATFASSSMSGCLFLIFSFSYLSLCFPAQTRSQWEIFRSLQAWAWFYGVFVFHGTFYIRSHLCPFLTWIQFHPTDHISYLPNTIPPQATLRLCIR